MIRFQIASRRVRVGEWVVRWVGEEKRDVEREISGQGELHYNQHGT